jgi:two-component system, cell cycle response regulator CpdR
MAERNRPTALVVEDDELQRSMLTELLEDVHMNVIQCASGEAAELVLNRLGPYLCLLFTDVNLSGTMTGAELAVIANERFPKMSVIVTSGHECPDLPPAARFMAKPWHPADVMVEAERACH